MDQIIAVSHTLAGHIEATGYVLSGKIQGIYNPVLRAADLGQATPLGRSVPERYVLSAGNLNAQKDHAVLLRAFAEIAGEYPGSLVILGEGPNCAALVDEAHALGLGDRFHLPGFVEPLPWFAHADAFALSSAWEGFGLVLVEAMALGVPVISTDCDFGPRELLCDGELGPLVPVGDHGALADGLRGVLNDPITPETLRERAAEFTVEAAVEAYLAAVDFVLGKEA